MCFFLIVLTQLRTRRGVGAVGIAERQRSAASHAREGALYGETALFKCRGKVALNVEGVDKDRACDGRESSVEQVEGCCSIWRCNRPHLLCMPSRSAKD